MFYLAILFNIFINTAQLKIITTYQSQCFNDTKNIENSY